MGLAHESLAILDLWCYQFAKGAQGIRLIPAYFVNNFLRSSVALARKQLLLSCYYSTLAF